jgi:uncharacterized protein (TIGR02145 family)
MNSIHLIRCTGIILLILTFSTTCKKDKEETTTANSEIKDIDGNVYKTITLGSQNWMQENLKTTHFSNGDIISNGNGIGIEWLILSFPAYAWYAFDFTEESFSSVYGLYYNWNAVKDSRNICPEGWHVPTDQEWTILTDYLGGLKVAGGKMKTKGTIEDGTGLWLGPNVATNSSGFSVLPAAGKTGNGSYWTIGHDGYFWTSTEASGETAWIRMFMGFTSEMYRLSDNGLKYYGYPVRCIKDSR